ncbi:IS66 family transposase [Bradyrhizobium sp. 23AC]
MIYYASSDRWGEHPQTHVAAFADILQADCYSDFEPLFDSAREGDPDHAGILLRPCEAGFFELAEIEKKAKGGKGKPVSPIRLEAVRCLDTLFEIERASTDSARTSGVPGEKQAGARRYARLATPRARDPLRAPSEVLKPMNYMLRRWADFARFLDESKICLSSNAAERAPRGMILGRRAYDDHDLSS